MSELTEGGRQILEARVTMGQPADTAVKHYVAALETEGVLLPGAAGVIADRAMGRRHGHQVGPHVEPIVAFSRVAEFLETPQGKALLNPEHKPADQNEPVLKAIYRRLGLPKDQVETLYAKNAVAFAGRTAAGLMAGVFRELVAVDGGKHLGYQPRTMDKPQPYVPPHPPGPNATERHHAVVRGSI
jgi:hypothetical protein